VSGWNVRPETNARDISRDKVSRDGLVPTRNVQIAKKIQSNWRDSGSGIPKSAYLAKNRAILAG
jgi:hypothetical protein